MDSVIDPAAFDDWVPFNINWQQPQPIVDWCYLGAERFTAPFSTETIDACLRRPVNLLFRRQTSIDELKSFRAVRPGVNPSGFIFHLSRSGSTLVSQMLSAVPPNLVISEAQIVDSAIRSARFMPAVSEAQRVEWLQQIVAVLGRPRGAEKNFILKFDAWSMLDWKLIRRAFPDVPWIFVYRDPVEVMVSHFDRRGAHLIPGVLDPVSFGMDPQTAVSVSPEEFCARMLAAICKAALDHHHEGGRLINYRQLPQLVETEILDYFHLVHSEDELATIRRAAQRDAKNPSATFQNDTEGKRQKATGEIREATDKWLYSVYEELELARREADD